MRTPKNQSFGLRLRCALAGLVAGVRSEHSLRLQLVALAGAILVLACFRPEPIWWAAVALSSAAVLAAELFNTALEHLADHVQPENHPQIQTVKDCAAAAVLVASCGAFGVGIALLVHLLTRV
jgi:diacylglycerol kinase (ATP)